MRSQWAFGLLLLLPLGVQAADTPLLHPTPDSWPHYNGSYDGQRHSKLQQITPQNVDTLALAWAFQTSPPMEIKSTPLLQDGVLYFTGVDNVRAVDARSGSQIWHYTYPPNKAFHIGSRGVAIYNKWLYFLASDGHLVSLDANDGKVRWIVQVADAVQRLLDQHGAAGGEKPRPGGHLGRL